MFNFFKKKIKDTEVINLKKKATSTPKRREYTGGKTWTTDEDMIIVGFYNLGISPKWIAEKLVEAGFERSENAVRIRLTRLQQSFIEHEV